MVKIILQVLHRLLIDYYLESKMHANKNLLYLDQ